MAQVMLVGITLISLAQAYIFVDSPTNSWNYAEEQCVQLYQSHLASYSNPSEFAELLDLVKAGPTAAYIGLYQWNKPQQSDWVWVDGSPCIDTTTTKNGNLLCVNDWKATEPSNEHGNEYCTELQRNSEKINDVPCANHEMRRFVCNDTPTQNPTNNPTKKPTASPILNPTVSPTKNPSENPTLSPTKNPSENPTLSPTKYPSETPTLSPSQNPSENPTLSPTTNSSENPTLSPSKKPSENPTLSPSKNPSQNPTPLSPTLPGTLTCGSIENGSYNDQLLIFTVRMPYKGDLIFNISTSKFNISLITAVFGVTAAGSAFDSVLVLNDAIAADYIFTVTANSGISGNYAVEIVCQSDSPTQSPTQRPHYSNSPSNSPTVNYNVTDIQSTDVEDMKISSSIFDPLITGLIIASFCCCCCVILITAYQCGKNKNKNKNMKVLRESNNHIELTTLEVTEKHDGESDERLKTWFSNTVDLNQYYDIFIKNGYDSMKAIKSITNKQQLQDIGIKMIGHQTLLLTEIAKLRKSEHEMLAHKAANYQKVEDVENVYNEIEVDLVDDSESDHGLYDQSNVKNTNAGFTFTNVTKKTIETKSSSDDEKTINAKWSCTSCTFTNHISMINCEMCNAKMSQQRGENMDEYEENINNEYKKIESVLKKCDSQDWERYLYSFKKHKMTDQRVEQLINKDSSDNVHVWQQLIPDIGVKLDFQMYFQTNRINDTNFIGKI